MVYLNRIYTKTGDGGETSLGDGSRVKKTSQRIAAFGAVDELNSSLGMAVAVGGISEQNQRRLTTIQNDLFDLGADLCLPETDPPPESTPLRVTESQVRQLEAWIDEDTARLEPLKSFILPGGTPAAAALHQSRTICRRSEIEVIRLAEQESVSESVLQYLNRLSDLLFTMARMENDQGRGDVPWIPGGERDNVTS